VSSISMVPVSRHSFSLTFVSLVYFLSLMIQDLLDSPVFKGETQPHLNSFVLKTLIWNAQLNLFVTTVKLLLIQYLLDWSSLKGTGTQPHLNSFVVKTLFWNAQLNLIVTTVKLLFLVCL